MRYLSLLTAALLLGLSTISCDRSRFEDPAAHHRSAGPEAAGAQSMITASAAQGGNAASGGGGANAAGARLNLEPIRQVLPPTDDGKIPTLTWDLREERHPDKVGWPKDQGNNKVFAIEGDFHFQLQVKDNKNFDGRVRQVQSRRGSGLIDGIEITTQPEETDEAYAHAKNMLESLGFNKSEFARLDAWHAKAKVGNYDNLQLSVKNSYDRVYTVHIVNDGTSELPWSVGLDIDWTKVCGCHG